MKIEVKNKQTFTPIEVKFTIDSSEVYEEMVRAVKEADIEDTYVNHSDWFLSGGCAKLDEFLDQLIRAVVK